MRAIVAHAASDLVLPRLRCIVPRLGLRPSDGPYAAAFRFPLSPNLADGDLLSALSNVLGGTLPIIEPVPMGLQLTFGLEPQPQKMTAGGFRLLSRDRTVAMTVTPSRLAVETTIYEHWETFRESID